MKIVGLSDIHGLLLKPEDVPQCDVVCICGDIVPLDYQNDTIKSVSWFLLNFLPWTDKLRCDKVIFIGGNHDFFLENLHKRCAAYPPTNNCPECPGIPELMWRRPSDVMKRLLVGTHKGASKLVYLCDNSYEYKGVTFYGTPWISDLQNWAFYKDDASLAKAYDNIPYTVDVLLTHMPSMLNDTGMVRQNGCFNSWAQYGNTYLAKCITERNIKYALCGHVHSGNHHPELCGGTQVVNVSIKDEDYKRSYEPFEFEVFPH